MIQFFKKKLKETAQLINKKTFKFSKESKENGELYGSIKPKEISNKIFENIKVEVKPSQIVLKTNQKMFSKDSKPKNSPFISARVIYVTSQT